MADCPACGERFAPARAQVYCTERCRRRAERKRRNDRQRQPATCEHCGTDYLALANSTARYCSHACCDASRLHTCRDCYRYAIPQNQGGAGLCERCRDLRRQRREWEARFWAVARRWLLECDRAQWRVCAECGGHILPNAGRWLYCSARCCRRSAARNARHRRRAQCKGGEPIYRLLIAERDGWTCQLCGEPVDFNADPHHPMAPSLDHVVPLALGGEHAPGNVQLAHMECNRLKGATIPH